MYSRDIAELEGKIRSQEQTFGEEHPAIVDSLGQLGHVYFVVGNNSDAERVMWRAITTCSKIYGQEHLLVAGLLADLGYMYESQERWAEAEHVYRLAYAVRTVNLGRTHHDCLQLARCMVHVARAQGKHIAERELDRLAKIAG